MPIINSYSAIVSGSGGSNINSVSSEQPYTYSFTGFVTIPANEKFLLIPGKQHARELVLSFSSESVELYFGGNNIPFETLNILEKYRDNQLGVDLWVKSAVECRCLVVIRSVEKIDYIKDDEMARVKVRLLLGTGDNYIERNASDFDADATQYLINLTKLKNSDSGTTGFKVFDIYCFTQDKTIDFNVEVENSNNYGEIALQLFDPINVAEAIFDLANDVVNLELNNLSNSFVGNVTRNAVFKNVINGQCNVIPDFSRHVGRFVARSNDTGNFDTCIIKEYIPNTDEYKGGTFVLTGEF